MKVLYSMCVCLSNAKIVIFVLHILSVAIVYLLLWMCGYSSVDMDYMLSELISRQNCRYARLIYNTRAHEHTYTREETTIVEQTSIKCSCVYILKKMLCKSNSKSFIRAQSFWRDSSDIFPCFSFFFFLSCIPFFRYIFHFRCLNIYFGNLTLVHKNVRKWYNNNAI